MSLALIFMKQFLGSGKKSRETFFSYKLSSEGITFGKSPFGTLEARFRCLQRAMVLNPFMRSEEKWSNII